MYRFDQHGYRFRVGKLRDSMAKIEDMSGISLMPTERCQQLAHFGTNLVRIGK